MIAAGHRQCARMTVDSFLRLNPPPTRPVLIELPDEVLDEFQSKLDVIEDDDALIVNASTQFVFRGQSWSGLNETAMSWKTLVNNFSQIPRTVMISMLAKELEGTPLFAANWFSSSGPSAGILPLLFGGGLKVNLVASTASDGLLPHIHFESVLLLVTGTKLWHFTEPTQYMPTREAQLANNATFACWQEEGTLMFTPDYWAHSVH